MAPHRSQRAAARASRNQQDNDVLSGMPVRQYVKAPITVSLVPPKAPRPKKDTVWKELPMPKGSELYPLHSQQILRQARMPWVPPEDRDDPDDADEDGEGEDADAFTVSKWVLLEQGQERPTKNLLADRPKSLPPLYGGAPGQAPMRKVKVRRVEPDGSVTFFEVLAPAGVPIEGEVAPSEAPAVATEAIAPGTVVEGVGVANSEGVVVAAEAATPQSNRRKPPPPKKRKKHGPGRGRKKVMLETPNADGTMEITEAATPGRTEGDDDDGDDDDGDDDGKEDGEMSDEVGTPTPTPSRGGLPEPPRSVPADLQSTNLTAVTAANAVPPVVVVEAEKNLPQIREPGDEGLAASADAMQVDSVDADAAAPVAADSAPIPTKEEPLEPSGEPAPPTTAPSEPSIVTETGAEALQQTEPAATSLEPAVENSLESAQPVPGVLTGELLAHTPTLQDVAALKTEQAAVEGDKLSNASQAGSPAATDAAGLPAADTSTTPMNIAAIAPPTEPETVPSAVPELADPNAVVPPPKEKLSTPPPDSLPEATEAPPPPEDVMAVDAILEEPKIGEEAAMTTPIPEAMTSATETDEKQDMAQAPAQPAAIDESDEARTQPPVLDEQPPIPAPSEDEQKPTEAAAPSDPQLIEHFSSEAPAALPPPTAQAEEVPATVAGEAIPPVPAPVADPLPEAGVPSESVPTQLTEPVESLQPAQPAQPEESPPKEDAKMEEPTGNTDSAAPIPDLLNPAPEAPTQVDIKDGVKPSEPTPEHPDPLAVPSFPEAPPTTEEEGDAGQTQAAKEDGTGGEEGAANADVDNSAGGGGGNGPTAGEGATAAEIAAADTIASTSAGAGPGDGPGAGAGAGAGANAGQEPPGSQPAVPHPAESGTLPDFGSEQKGEAAPATDDGQTVPKMEV